MAYLLMVGLNAICAEWRTAFAKFYLESLALDFLIDWIGCAGPGSMNQMFGYILDCSGNWIEI